MVKQTIVEFFSDKVSRSPEWPQTHVVKNDLECLILLAATS